MYMYAWKQGIKTTYYLRSRPATSIAKTTVKKSSTSTVEAMSFNGLQTAAEKQADTEAKKQYSESEVIACSLDNPEACEACQ